MTVNRGLFVRQVGTAGTTPLEARRALAGLLAENSPGVPRQGILAQANTAIVLGASGWSYTVRACNPVTTRTAGEGVYLPTFTGNTAVNTTVAPGTGFRYDLIWVKQNDPEKGDPDNLAILGVTQGIESSSPAAPYGDVPDGALVLAEALIPAGATGTNGATITQVWRHTATRGAPIPVRNVTERNELTAHPGLRVVRLDKGGRIETYHDGTWGVRTVLVALGAGWGNQADALPFRVETLNGEGHLEGYIRRNTGTSDICGVIPSGARPVSDRTFDVVSENGSFGEGPKFRIYITASTGVMTVNRLGGPPPAWDNVTTKLPISIGFPLA